MTERVKFSVVKTLKELLNPPPPRPFTQSNTGLEFSPLRPLGHIFWRGPILWGTTQRINYILPFNFFLYRKAQPSRVTSHNDFGSYWGGRIRGGGQAQSLPTCSSLNIRWFTIFLRILILSIQQMNSCG